jgi:hypothetical protein
MKKYWKGLRIRTWIFFILGCLLVLISYLSKTQLSGVFGGIGLFVWFIGFIDMIFAHGETEPFESFEDKSMKYASTASNKIKNPDAPSQDDRPLYLNLDKDFHRLLEIEEAIGEIGAIFDRESAKTSPQNSSDALRYIADSVNKLRIPGFFAYPLAQEGLSLLHIVAASCAIGKQSGGSSSDKIDRVLKHIDEVEPVLRTALYDMEPYKSMNAKETIEVITARIAEKERQ